MSKISATSRKNANADRNAIAPDHIFAAMLDVSSPLTAGMGSGLDLGAVAGMGWDMEEISSEDLLKCFEQAGQQLGHDAGLERLRDHLMNLPRQAAKGLARQIARGAAAGVLVALALGLVPSGAMAADPWGEDKEVTIPVVDPAKDSLTVNSEQEKALNLTVNETGTLTIQNTGSVTVSGDTTLNGGTINIENNSGLKSENITLNTGTLNLNGTASNIAGFTAKTININGANINIGPTNYGEISAFDGSTKVLHSKGTLINNKNFYIRNNVSYTLSDEGKITNNGVMQVLGGTLVIDNENFENNSTFAIKENGSLEVKNTNVIDKLAEKRFVINDSADENTNLVIKEGGSLNSTYFNNTKIEMKGSVKIDSPSLNFTEDTKVKFATNNVDLTVRNLSFTPDSGKTFEISNGTYNVASDETDFSPSIQLYDRTIPGEILKDAILNIGVANGSNSAKLALSNAKEQDGILNTNLTVNKDSTLVFEKGSWLGNGNSITVNSGATFNVQPSAKVSLLGINNYSENNIINGNLSVTDFTNSDGKINVNGTLSTTNFRNKNNTTGNSIIEVDGTKDNLASLHIKSGGEIENKHTSGLSYIAIRSYGTLDMDQGTFEKLFDDANNGKVFLDDNKHDVEDQKGPAALIVNGNVTIDSSKFASTSGGNGLVLYRNGILVADKLTLSDNNNQSLNFSDGAQNGSQLVVNSLSLTPKDTNDNFSIKGADIVINGGNPTLPNTEYTALSLNGNGTIKLEAGDTSTNVATDNASTAPTKLTLSNAGDAPQQINANVSATGSGTDINVNDGTWQMAEGKSFTVDTGATLTVAEASEDATPEIAKPDASLTTGDFTLTDGTVTVNRDGTLNTGAFESNGSGDTNVIGGIFSATDVTINNGTFTAKVAADGQSARVVADSLTLKDGVFSVTGGSTANIGSPIARDAGDKLIVGGSGSAGSTPTFTVGDATSIGTINVNGNAKVGNGGTVTVGNESYDGQDKSTLNITGKATVDGGDVKVNKNGEMTVGGTANFTGGNTTIEAGGKLTAMDLTATKSGSDPVITVKGSNGSEESSGILETSHNAAKIYNSDWSEKTDVTSGKVGEGAVKIDGGRVELVGPEGETGYHSATDLKARFTGDNGKIDINNWHLTEFTAGDVDYFQNQQILKDITGIASDDTRASTITNVDGGEGEHSALSGEWKAVVLGDPDVPGTQVQTKPNDKLVVTNPTSSKKDELVLVGGAKNQEGKSPLLVSKSDGTAADVEVKQNSSITFGTDKDVTYGSVADVTLSQGTQPTPDSEITPGTGGILNVNGKTENGNQSEFSVNKIIADTGAAVNVDGAILNVENKIESGTNGSGDINVENGTLRVNDTAHSDTAAIIADKATVTDGHLGSAGTFKVNTLTVTRNGVVNNQDQGAPIALAAVLPEKIEEDVHVQGNLEVGTINLVNKTTDPDKPTVYVEGGDISNGTAGGTNIYGNGGTVIADEVEDGSGFHGGNITAENIGGNLDGQGHPLAFTGKIIASNNIEAQNIIMAGTPENRSKLEATKGSITASGTNGTINLDTTDAKAGKDIVAKQLVLNDANVDAGANINAGGTGDAVEKIAIYGNGKVNAGGTITASNINADKNDDASKPLAFSGNIIAGGDIIANEIIANGRFVAEGKNSTEQDKKGYITADNITARGGDLTLIAKQDIKIGDNTPDATGNLSNVAGENINVTANKLDVGKDIAMKGGKLTINADEINVGNNVTADNSADMNIVANSVNIANDLTMAGGKLDISNRDGTTAPTTTVNGTTTLTGVTGNVAGTFTSTAGTGNGNIAINGGSNITFDNLAPNGTLTVAGGGIPTSQKLEDAVFTRVYADRINPSGTLTVSDLGVVAAKNVGNAPGEGQSDNNLRSNIVVNNYGIFGVGYDSVAQMEAIVEQGIRDTGYVPTGVFVAASSVDVSGGSISVGNNASTTAGNGTISVGDHGVVAVDKNRLKGDTVFTGVSGVSVSENSGVYIANPSANSSITMAKDNNGDNVVWSVNKNVKIMTSNAFYNARWDNAGETINIGKDKSSDRIPVTTEIGSIVDRYNDGRADMNQAGARYIDSVVGAYTRYINNEAGSKLNAKAAAATIETPARLAAIAGAPQMTGAAHHAAINIANQRTSFAAPNARMTSYNGTTGQIQTGASGGNDYKSGVGVWVQPMYQSTNTHGMKAGNLKMDTNGALAGVAAGADVTIADTVRLGVTVNGGKGYSTGSGDFNKAKNDFSFVGVGAYAGVRVDQVGVTADVNYTSAFNKMRADVPNGMGSNLKSDVNSSAISVGLRGEYDIPVNDNVSIVPHVGVRHTNLKVDSYKVKQGGKTLLKADESSQSYWTFPVGVAVAGNVDTGNGWYIRPSADVGVIPAAGNIKNKNSVRFTGIDRSADVSSRIMDNWTFSGQTGVEFGNDMVSFGVTYNLQASEHLTNHGIFGTFRVDF